MLEEELIKIWQSSPNQEQVKFEKSRLMLDVQSNVDRFHKGMKWLYLREGISAIIMIPIFIVYAFVFPHIVTKIASILLALWAIYILLVIRNTQKKKPEEYALNYLEYLHQTKTYLELQKKLRDNVFTWYALPLIVLSSLFILGLYIGKPKLVEKMIIVVAICLIFGGIIHLLNRISNKKFVEPKLNKVNDLIKNLEE